MTAEELITEAKQNRFGPPRDDCLTPSVLLECHGIILQCLLNDIDYEGDPGSLCAMAARMIAGIAAAAEDRVAENERNEAALAAFVVN